ncbi:hypothetical protein CF336_g8103, partial [Tilletia laevis]
MTSTGHSVRSRASSFVPLTEQEDGGCGAQLARRTHLRHLVNLSSQGGIVFNTGIVFESVCPSIGSHILITGVHQGINRLKDWEQQAISNVIVEDCTTPAFMDTIAKLNKKRDYTFPSLLFASRLELGYSVLNPTCSPRRIRAALPVLESWLPLTLLGSATQPVARTSSPRSLTRPDSSWASTAPSTVSTMGLGDTLQTSKLSGTGHQEVRLASPLDDSMLIAGSNGLQHHQRLLRGGQNLRGCNGYVFRLEPSNGDIIAQDGLSGYGNHEISLDATLQHDTLIVGTNGYCLGLSMDNVAMKWTNDMSGAGKDITSVLGGNGDAYAACRGIIFRIDASNGNELHKNTLLDTGNHEVRMALSSDALNLYVGANGYGIGVRVDSLETKYSISLSGSGNTITSVAPGLDRAFYANNGYVFEFDSQGSIIGQNPLEGYGNHETRVCADNAAAGMLLVGINGYALGLKLSSFAPSYGPWMRRMAAKIGPKMLHQVALPGTHDSGTYGITLSSSVADDVSSWYKAASVNIWAGLTRNAIMKGWSIAQPLDIQHQLSSGIRYLDLRVQASKNVFTGNYSHNIVHSLFSVSIDDVLAQVDTFLSESGNENEVVLLDFNHFFNYDAAAHADLASCIKTQLNNKLAPASLTANVTLDQLWKSSGRVVTFYSDNTSVTQNDFLWSPKIISSPWPDMRTATDVLNFFDASVPVTAATFYVLQGVITPDGDMIGNGLIPFTDNPSN